MAYLLPTNITDADYLHASARVRALESSLLTPERLRRMAEATSDQDALKVLSECGYGEDLSLENLDQAIQKKREDAFSEAEKMLPDPTLLNIFRLKFDYHNIKCLLKANAQNQPFEQLLLNGGSLPLTKLLQATAENDFADFPPLMREAANEALEVLQRTHDPRLADTALDRAMFAQMLQMATASSIKFLVEYVKLTIDSANLRLVVRLYKMGQEPARIAEFASPGGNLSLDRLRTDFTAEAIEAAYLNTPLQAAAQVGAEALRGQNSLAAVDQAADNALMHYLRQAKYIAIGAEPVLAFYAAAELESTVVNTVMAGRKAGQKPDTIMERLRMTYV